MGSRHFQDPAAKIFDDFRLGDVMVRRGRTIDIGDISNFAGLTGDCYPLHIDEERARGTRIAHGPLTFADRERLPDLAGEALGLPVAAELRLLIDPATIGWEGGLPVQRLPIDPEGAGPRRPAPRLGRHNLEVFGSTSEGRWRPRTGE